jgi:hypothetical protein
MISPDGGKSVLGPSPVMLLVFFGWREAVIGTTRNATKHVTRRDNIVKA